MPKILALIPARGGSKGIIKKNIYPLNGKPLLEWSVSAARNVKEIDRIVVSTDDDEIARVAKGLSVEVAQRPKELCEDDSLVVDAVRYTIRELAQQHYQIDYLILLEPTSPLRSSEDIKKVIAELDQGADSVATFCEAALNPHRAWTIKEKTPSVFIEGAIPWLPRQKLPKAWELNGAVYGINVKEFSGHKGVSLLFGKSAAVKMPSERSVDIDNLLDLMTVEAIMGNGELR